MSCAVKKMTPPCLVTESSYQHFLVYFSEIGAAYGTISYCYIDI